MFTFYACMAYYCMHVTGAKGNELGWMWQPAAVTVTVTVTCTAGGWFGVSWWFAIFGVAPRVPSSLLVSS
jgi:hypothetical protein